MKSNLKSRLLVSYAIGFCSIAFNLIGFSARSGGITTHISNYHSDCNEFRILYT